MKHTPIKLGPLALLLAVISICLTTLALLNVSTAKAEERDDHVSALLLQHSTHDCRMVVDSWMPENVECRSSAAFRVVKPPHDSADAR